MPRPLTVLAPTRYPGVFNCPRGGRHHIVRTPFVPLNKVSSRLQGIMLHPPQRRRYDLIHAVNRIPLVRKPFVITFESHLPRVFSHEGGLAELTIHRESLDLMRNAGIRQCMRNLRAHAAAPA